jgi:hypothetical protein
MHEIRTAEPAGYAEFLAELKQRIERAQLRASLVVKRELVLLYWQIGREILSRQDRESCGLGLLRDAVNSGRPLALTPLKRRESGSAMTDSQDNPRFHPTSCPNHPSRRFCR